MEVVKVEGNKVNMKEYNMRYKFRVWHTEFSRFLTKEEWYLDMEGRLNFYNLSDLILCKSPHITEQCTGAMDKNGKLIYEGDIIKVKRCFTKPKVVEKTFRGISKHEIGYEFIEGDEEVGYILWGFYKFIVSFRRYDDFEDFTGIDHRIEVIGNVHENFELIKGNQNL